jgi:threonine synthase
VKVAKEHLGDSPMVTLATAHPAKFPAAVAEATGITPPLPPRMQDLYDRPERLTRLPTISTRSRRSSERTSALER